MNPSFPAVDDLTSMHAVDQTMAGARTSLGDPSQTHSTHQIVGKSCLKPA
jgi:hypothetical protein